MSTVTYPNAQAVAELYRGYLADPGSVDPGWQAVFRDLDPEARGWLESLSNGASPTAPAAVPSLGEDARTAALDSVRALMLIRSYRVRGHLEADLDPLGLAPKEPHEELDPASYGFTEADMDRPIYLHGVLGLRGRALAIALVWRGLEMTTRPACWRMSR